jgi:DNA-binding NtrC family response regulator
VLQERTFERVGESRSRTSDARIIAATNADLARQVAAGRFREDLYYRLRVVPIEIPPLRERREDIEPLTRALLARVASRQGRIVRLSPNALRAILAYCWPGNVRELENALEFAVAVSRRETILPEDLPPNVLEGRGQRAMGMEKEPPQPSDAERERLLAVLEEHHWHREAAARALGISRTTLWRRMREAGLE